MVALGLKGVAAGKIGIAVQRIDLDCLTIICNCAVDFALSSIDDGTVVVSLCKSWIDVERLAEVRDSALVFSFSFIGRAAIVEPPPPANDEQAKQREAEANAAWRRQQLNSYILQMTGGPFRR